MHCDLHMTLYSSCALEAPSLGIPNILVDIHNMASKYYNSLLSEYHTKIIKAEDEFYEAMEELIKLQAINVKINNSSIFISNYNKRVKKYFQKEQ